MNFRTNRKEQIEPNLTPLIDVVFLLLIFFMVSTTFDKDTRIRVQLPEAATQDEATKPEEQRLTIVVDAEGRYYVNQQEVINTESATLRRAIEIAADGRRDIPLIITADANTTHQSVVRVMDVASQLGFSQMTFAAKQPATP
ncbi:MAG: biopolymer transporter ExbD [Gammaproteobacteria bacterium]|nr:biopolymer transporter ExbD [Gammaproteobacteria bacterium]